MLALALTACADDSPLPVEPSSSSPLAAAAGARLSFLQLSAGNSHVCGTAAGGSAWCWGNDLSGQLGDGDAGLAQCGDVPCSKRAVAVAGGLRFRHVTAGFNFSCGVTTHDRIWCWGDNEHGHLGTGTESSSTTPVEVAGNRRWRQVRAGDNLACGITTAGKAFCWGLNNEGELGNGTTAVSLVPVAVAGGLQWSQLTVSSEHTCGIATDGRGPTSRPTGSGVAG
jgi:alpha-tubulin suppressor-like RCC1 family protein